MGMIPLRPKFNLCLLEHLGMYLAFPYLPQFSLYWNAVIIRLHSQFSLKTEASYGYAVIIPMHSQFSLKTEKNESNAVVIPLHSQFSLKIVASFRNAVLISKYNTYTVHSQYKSQN